MNLVVGATGTLGTEICRLLRAGAKPARALVRTNSDPFKVQKLDMGKLLSACPLKLRSVESYARSVL